MNGDDATDNDKMDSAGHVSGFSPVCHSDDREVKKDSNEFMAKEEDRDVANEME